MTASDSAVDRPEDPAEPPASPAREKSRHRFHPLAWVPTLYTAESLPFNAVILVSVMMYKSLGLSDSAIAFWTAWLLLPWTLKPFFSPFLEMFSTKKLFVIATEIIAGAGFGVMAFCLPLPFRIQATLGVFFVMAFNSATHDTAADGLYISSLDKTGQAKYVGFQSAFWNLGQVVAQGGLVWIAGELEDRYDVIPAWMIVWGIFAVLMGLLALYHWVILPRGTVAKGVQGLREVALSFKDVGVDFFLKKHIWWLIAFSLIYRTAEGQIEKIAQLFMRAKVGEGGLGLSTADVGLAYGAAGTIGMVVGSLVGGWFAAKVGLKKALVPLALIFNVPNALFTYLAFSQDNTFWVVATCATIEKFSLGMGFVAMTLVLMQQMAPGKFSTAHYGFATALMGVGMMVPSMTSGFVSDWLGYQDFFVYILIAGIPSIVIAAILPIQEEVKDVELPEGTPGRVVKSAAWATALAAGSLYLFITFSGLVTGPVLFGEFISFTVVLVFVVLVVLGCALAVFSVRNALAARRVLCEQGQQVKNQSVLAMVLAAVAVVTWISCLGALLDKNAEMNATRAECTSQKTLAACEVVCQNDGDYATCQQVMDAHSQALDAKPDDSKAAARAYASVRKALEIACFTEEQVADCMALAEIYRNPSRYGAAGESVSVDLREAKRYYNKACLLGDPTGCAGVDKMRAAIEAEE